MKNEAFERQVEITRKNQLTYEEAEKRQIICPAAMRTNHNATQTAVKCRIDDAKIVPTEDPSTFRLCTSENYINCPAWRLKKDEESEINSL